MTFSYVRAKEFIGKRMKKHRYLILLALTFVFSFAQPSNILSNYIGSVKEILIEEELDDFGQRIKHELLFNESGNLYESTLYSYNFRDGSLQSKTITTYDQNKQPLAKQVLDASEELIQQTLYRYNEANLLTEEVTYDSEGGIMLQQLYTYNEAGKETLREYYQRTTLVANLESNYDGEGNLTKQIQTSSDTTLLSEVIFSEQGRVFEQINYQEDGSVASRDIVSLDEQDNVTESIGYTPDGENKTTYEYNEDGLILSESFEMDGFATVYRYEYEFDDAGNWIKQIQIEDFGGVSEPQLTLYRTIEYY